MKGWDFPPGMDTAFLHPAVSSQCTTSSGAVVDVPCTTLGKTSVQSRECPEDLGFVPADQDASRTCVSTCPTKVVTLDEWGVLWLLACIPAIAGFVGNLFLVATWGLEGRSEFAKKSTQLKACVGFGLLYGIICAIPSFALKHDVGCGSCGTDECVGTSLLCTLNRMAPYLVLGIQINLAMLTRGIYRALKPGSVPPLLILALAYLLDSPDNMAPVGDGDRAELNLVRHAFSCSMRFESPHVEWLLLRAPCQQF